MGACPESHDPELSTDLGSELSSFPLPSTYIQPAPHPSNPVSPSPWGLELIRVFPQPWLMDPLFGNSFLQLEPQVLGAEA